MIDNPATKAAADRPPVDYAKAAGSRNYPLVPQMKTWPDQAASANVRAASWRFAQQLQRRGEVDALRV